MEKIPNKNLNIKDNKIQEGKKYHCQCIDCIGEWMGYYKNIEELQKDFDLYCRSKKATYKIIED